MISKAWSSKWLKEGKWSLFYLAIGQRINFIAMKIDYIKKSIVQITELISNACLSLRCQIYGLETIWMLEIEWAKELKIYCRIEEASEMDLQFVEFCSK